MNTRPTKEELISAEAAIKKDRIEKDAYFKSADSPLSDSVKALFHGLLYFEFGPAYVFKVKLKLYENPRELDMITSKGKVKHYVEYGYFEFDLNGIQRLNGYRPKPALEGHPNYLFIPFKDATTGKESYPAGRYMELTLNESSDEYILDLNAAYNPWCAYSNNFNCPYPPEENNLKIPVHAGEKKFSLGTGH
jgi:uncharacterized protein (DUF1684 family)